MHRLLLLALVLVACGPTAPPTETPAPVPSPAAPAPTPAEAPPAARLPEGVTPQRYRLELTIDPSRDRFSGVVEIDVELAAPRGHLWLHGNDLKISEATATAGGATMALTYEQVTDGGVAKVTADSPLPAGPATLRFVYDAPFNDRLNGLYKVTHEGEDYAFTQMEPVWGRKVFPSFDEPAFKVPYEVTLVTPEEAVALANTKEIAAEPAGDMVRHRYAPTEPLPTYLLAFAVGPLEVVEAPPIAPNEARKTPLPFRGVAAKGEGKQLAFALKHTPAILAELERYFGIAYPYDKLDIVAVPDKGGAMENAGLVTFRDWLLLLEGEEASTDQKRAFAYVMAHELAHQWFGNLVTMPWWDDIWLNEAFATWMGYRVVEAWDPSYQGSVRQIDGVHRAMRDDSLLSARQIRQPVVDEDGIHSAFDVITYRKGGGVLSMFERWMGPEVFRTGLQRYMETHRHGNATAEDLLKAFGEAAGKDVKTPFSTFIEQPGLPEVAVELSCEGAPKVTLSQQRYLPLGSKGDAKASTWQIPVCLRYGLAGKKTGETCTLLTAKSATVDLDAKTCPTWVMPNAGAAGYYQWTAPPELVKDLADHTDALTTRELLSMNAAVWAMMRAGRLAADDAFTVLKPLAGHDHPDVAEGPQGILSMARRWLWDDEALRKRAEAEIRTLYGRRLTRLGWRARPRETPETKLLRRNLIGWLAITGQDAKTQQQVDRLAKQYLGLGGDGALHPDAIEPDLAGTILYAAAQRADRAMFDAIRKHFLAATDPSVRGDLLGALAAPLDPELAKEARSMVMGDQLRVSERMAPLNVQFRHPTTRPAAWAWLQSNLEPLLEDLSERRAGWLPSLTTSFCDAAKAPEVKALFEPRLDRMAGGKRELAKATEALQTCAARRAHLTPSLKALLQ